MNEKLKREKQYSALVAGLNAPTPPTPSQETASPRKRKPKTKEVSEPVESEPTVKATIYIPKSLHRRVRVALADRDERLTLTDLAVNLLREWADKQG